MLDFCHVCCIGKKNSLPEGAGPYRTEENDRWCDERHPLERKTPGFRLLLVCSLGKEDAEEMERVLWRLLDMVLVSNRKSCGTLVCLSSCCDALTLKTKLETRHRSL